MKIYINYLPDLDRSVEVATRCRESCEQFGYTPIMWPASTTFPPEMKVHPSMEEDKFSRRDRALANFYTNYRLWQEVDSPSLILEHDAVMTAPIPSIEWPAITNVGKPSFGAYETKKKPGLYPLFSKVGGYFPGAHGYIVTEEGAAMLLEKAEEGAMPLDLYLHRERFDCYEYFPWFIEARDSFTTIQKEEGCRAKHNWGEGYDIL